MAEAVGNGVVALRRVRFGPLELGDLAEGDARRLTAEEIAALGRRPGADGSGADLDDDGPLARAVVEVDQDQLLPGAEREAPADDRDRLRRPDERSRAGGRASWCRG